MTNASASNVRNRNARTNATTIDSIVSRNTTKRLTGAWATVVGGGRRRRSRRRSAGFFAASRRFCGVVSSTSCRSVGTQQSCAGGVASRGLRQSRSFAAGGGNIAIIRRRRKRKTPRGTRRLASGSRPTGKISRAAGAVFCYAAPFAVARFGRSIRHFPPISSNEGSIACHSPGCFAAGVNCRLPNGAGMFATSTCRGTAACSSPSGGTRAWRPSRRSTQAEIDGLRQWISPGRLRRSTSAPTPATRPCRWPWPRAKTGACWRWSPTAMRSPCWKRMLGSTLGRRTSSRAASPPRRTTGSSSFCTATRRSATAASRSGGGIRFDKKFPLAVEGRNLLRVLREEFADWLPRLSYVKVDAEGYDLAILESILPVLRERQPVVRAEVFKKLPAATAARCTTCWPRPVTTCSATAAAQRRRAALIARGDMTADTALRRPRHSAATRTRRLRDVAGCIWPICRAWRSGAKRLAARRRRPPPCAVPRPAIRVAGPPDGGARRACPPPRWPGSPARRAAAQTGTP